MARSADPLASPPVPDSTLPVEADVESSPDVEPSAGPSAGPIDEPSRLALAYQAGDRAALAPLHDLLRPMMAAVLARYPERPGAPTRALPATLERGDLQQESWIILAELASRWRPEGGSFGAYFRVSFRWAVARYVRRNSPSRRARGVRVLGAELPDVQAELDHQAGADGRDWDGDLAWVELLEHLSEQERAVLMLHLADQKPFSDVAAALALTRPAAYRLYRRALRRVQGSSVRVGDETVFLDATSLNLERQGQLVALVLALHAGAGPGGRVPGRAWLTANTDLSEQRLSRLLKLLAEAGCIQGRAARQAGWLVHPTPAATLAALGIRAESTQLAGVRAQESEVEEEVGRQASTCSPTCRTCGATR